MAASLSSMWQGCGASVRGAAHIRAGLPKQDDFTCRITEAGGAVIAILYGVYGHGSARSFRSEAGAQFAVQVAGEALQQFADGFRDPANRAAAARASEVDIPKRIVQAWQAAVARHVEQQRFAEEELAKLDAATRKSLEKQPLLAYGTTLLCVLVTEGLILYMQVGEGDIVVVSDQGETTRPLPRYERLFGNETTSLCSLGSGGRSSVAGLAGAWSEFRTRLETRMDREPSLIVVSTDGYANSFRSEADFVKVGPDLLMMIRAEGLEGV